MTDTLIQFVFGAGLRLLDLCEEAKQCEAEVIRIAVRTQNVLGTLKVGSLFLLFESFFSGASAMIFCLSRASFRHRHAH